MKFIKYIKKIEVNLIFVTEVWWNSLKKSNPIHFDLFFYPIYIRIFFFTLKSSFKN